MTQIITVSIQLLAGQFGVFPAVIGILALVLTFLSLFLFLKLRSAREKIHQFARQLGYEPPYGDGTEVLYEELRKDIVLRGKEEQIKQLEQQLADLEVKDERNESALNALLKRVKEVEDQLQQASDRNSELAAQAREEAKARVAAAELMEMRILNLEAEKNGSVNALEQHARELEEQLQQASTLNNQIEAQADEQAQAHRITVEQMEESIRGMEAERSASLAAIELRAQELEEQLQKASMLNNQIAAQADEQAQAHRFAVEQMEERMRSIDAENNSALIALQQRAHELEDQLQKVSARNNEIMAQAITQALTHRTAVEQLEQRLRSAEDESNAGRQRAQEFEEQLQQASLRNNEMMAQASEQAQTHRAAVEQLEQRLREMEAEDSARLAALQQHAKELEEHLQQASLHNQSTASIAQQEALERNAGMEQRIRELESENNARESRVQALQAQVKDLEDRLRQAAERSAAQNEQAAPDASQHLLRRSEWMTACAVGAVRSLGLVAAEAYAAAAVAANAQDRESRQLLVELTNLRSASRGSMPSVAEAVTTFDERSAGFFGADLAGAAHLAETEALDRYQRGLNRTALLVTNFSLALHKQLGTQNLPDTRRLQELRAALLARLGSDSTRPAAS